MFKRRIHNWHLIKGQPVTDLDRKILAEQEKGHLVPKRKLIKTPEQIEGIRRSGVVNTGVLDLIEREIKEGMSTAQIDKLVYEYTTDHGAIPAPLNYEGFPKSVCTSINEVVCHGIPSEKEILRDGDIINVDVSTILDGYYSDASRMFMIGNVSPEKRRLVEVTKECLEIGPRPLILSVMSAISVTRSSVMPRRMVIPSCATCVVTVSGSLSTRSRRSFILAGREQECCLCPAWSSRSSR